ncbi:putative bark agglutinin LECRPA3 [Trifolium repens]|nr:putative bark agglutinin LECRPA3 [Trifolium repens]
MAFFPTNQNLFCVMLVILTTFLLLATELVNSQKTVSFDITNFTNSESSVSLQGAAVITRDGLVSLTPTDNEHVGRLLYLTPVSIWDSNTGNIASFITSFRFDVVSFLDLPPASGFVFHLVPEDKADIPSNSAGGYLGIVDSQNANNQFVGVEFDTVSPWDPPYNHVGIDVNSVLSLNTVKWNRVSGSFVDVDISYDPVSKTLNVVVKYRDGTFKTFDQVIDLKQVLPPTVRIGFSAAITTDAHQFHNIHSWSFHSNLDTTTTTTSANNIASI